MKKLIFSMGVMCMSMMIASCGASKKSTSFASLEGEWNIVEVDGNAIKVAKDQPVPYIGFDIATKRIYGNSGCNRMMGTFIVDSVKPELLRFGPIAGTRMACPDMTIEQNILGALAKVSSFEVLASDEKDGNAASKIALCGKEGKKLIVIEKRAEESAPATISALEGEWLIKTVDGTAIGKSEKVPFIGFDLKENRIYGNAGCNSINGTLKTDDKNPSDLDLSHLATTMMMCADMQTETTVLKALNAVKTFKVLNDNTIAFCNAEGNEIMTLQKK